MYNITTTAKTRTGSQEYSVEITGDKLGSIYVDVAYNKSDFSVSIYGPEWIKDLQPRDVIKGSVASMLKTQNEIVATIVGRIEESIIGAYGERVLGMRIVTVNNGNGPGYVVVSSKGSEGNFTTLKEARKWLVMLYLIGNPAFRTHIARKALYNMGGHLSYDLLLRMSRGYLFPEWLTRSKCGNGQIVVDGDVIL